MLYECIIFAFSDPLSDRLRSLRLLSLKVLPIRDQVDLDHFLLDNFYHWPPLGIGATIFRNQSTGKLSLQLLFNGATYHGPEIALNLLSNLLLGDSTSNLLDLENPIFLLYFGFPFAFSSSATIQPSIELYGEEDNPFGPLKDMFKDVLGNMGVAMAVITAFSIMTATMVMPLVDERGTRFKHQVRNTTFTLIILATIIRNSENYILPSSLPPCPSTFPKICPSPSLSPVDAHPSPRAHLLGFRSALELCPLFHLLCRHRLHPGNVQLDARLSRLHLPSLAPLLLGHRPHARLCLFSVRKS